MSFFWKGSELERKRVPRWQRWREETVAEGQWQERRETRACWTCGKTGDIAAWCRKGGNNNLYAIGEDDSENVEELTDNKEDLQA